MSDNDNLSTRTAIVEKEIATMHGVFNRFDLALEKITEISTSLKQIIAVHDLRLVEREKADLAIFELIEKRKEEYGRGIERVHQKMDDLSNDIRREVRHEINEQYDELKEAVRRFEASQKDIADKIDRRIDTQLQERDRRFADLEKDRMKINERLHAIERKAWFMMGGAGLLGVLIGSLDKIAQFLGNG